MAICPTPAFYKRFIKKTNHALRGRIEQNHPGNKDIICAMNNHTVAVTLRREPLSKHSIHLFGL